MAGTDDLMHGLHELSEAHDGYHEAWEMWRGDSEEEFSSAAVSKALARTAGKYRINIAKLPIVSLADRLKVSAFTALNGEGVKDDDADRVLQDVIIAPNKLFLQAKKLVRNTLILGDGYWFIWSGEAEGSVTVAYNDPRTTRAVYAEDSDIDIAFVVRRWATKGGIRASVLYGDRLELGWFLKEGKSEEDTGAWVREPGSKDVPNLWGRPPVFHFRTDLPYGVPEHLDAYGPQAGMQKMSATMAFSGEAAGLRGRYLLTAPNASLNGDGPDNPNWDDDLDAGPATASNSRIRGGAAEIQVFEGITAAGEWSAPDMAQFITSMDQYARYSALVTRTSGKYSDPHGQHPSGAALRVADAPEASKADDRMEFFDGDLRDAMAFALRVAGFEDRKVDVRWKPAGIVDDVDMWTIVGQKIAAGVPTRTALAETGLYEQSEIDGWLSDASVEMDVARRVRLLGDVSYAVQGLGQAVTLGLMSEADAARIVQQTVGQLAPEVTPDGVEG